MAIASLELHRERFRGEALLDNVNRVEGDRVNDRVLLSSFHFPRERSARIERAALQ